MGNWSEMQPTGRRLDVLPVWVLTRVLTPPCRESLHDVVDLGLHVVSGVGSSLCLRSIISPSKGALIQALVITLCLFS
jgi:hypothetical protein